MFVFYNKEATKPNLTALFSAHVAHGLCLHLSRLIKLTIVISAARLVTC